MLFLNKRDIEKTVDLNAMMDQIEEAYRIFENKLDGVIKIAVYPSEDALIDGVSQRVLEQYRPAFEALAK